MPIVKLGPHVLMTSSSAGDWARAGARVVKLVDYFGLAEEVAALPHKPLLIGRVVETEFDPNAMRGRDPFLAADSYIAQHLDAKIRANPAIGSWEGPNECVITERWAMEWYALFLYSFAASLRRVFGKTAVIGSWAVGNPDYPLWGSYRPALDAVREFGAILSRHSYAGPDKSTWSYLLLRHREDNAIFASMGYSNLPLVITECGADSVPFGNPPGRPWKDLYGDNAQAYYDQILAPLDAELQADSYVLGAAVFTSGGGWDRHNIEGEVSRLLIANTAPPSVPPPPQDKATHIVVNCVALNVRQYPYTTIAPPLIRQIPAGARVKAEGFYQSSAMPRAWACISPNSNEWVNSYYLAPV